MGISKTIADLVGIKRSNDNIQMPNNGDFSSSAMHNSSQPYPMDPNVIYQQQLMNQQNAMNQNQQMHQSQFMNQPLQNSYPINNQYIVQPQPQTTMDYQKKIIDEKNAGYIPEQQLIMPRPRQNAAPRRHNSVPINYENGGQQQTLDFNRQQPVEYGNFQEPQILERSNSDFQFYQQTRQNQMPSNIPVQQQFSNQQYIQPQQYRQQMAQEPIDYRGYYEEESMKYQNYPPQQMIYNDYETPFQNHIQERRTINILPTQIAREVRSEKLRVAILMIIGLVGIVLTSILLAGYYKMAGLSAEELKTASFAGFKFQQTPYPFISIVFLIVGAFLFFLGLTDYSLLYANVKKYERDLIAGNEQVPYFITRNYRNILSRGIYVTWICFATYIVGAISLGILYGLQGLKDAGNNEFYILFWKVGSLKSFKSDITINIIVLIATLVAHITNIVWSRSRKNNVIAYYGAPIISSEEERIIKKRANKICIIVTCVLLAIVLFAVAIPWAILRRRRGKSLMPFGKANN